MEEEEEVEVVGRKEAKLFLRSLSSLTLHVVDPSLVNVHRTGVQHKLLVLQELLDERLQDIPEDVLTSDPSAVDKNNWCSITCKSHDHSVV